MATGIEMALGAVFKFLGVEKDDMLKMFFATRDAVYSADNRLTVLQQDMAEQRAMLQEILKRLEGGYPNERSDENSRSGERATGNEGNASDDRTGPIGSQRAAP